MCIFLAADENCNWECEGRHEVVNIFLGVKFLADLAAEIFGVDGETVQYQEGAFHFDEHGARLGSLVETHLRSTEPVSPLELDAWAHLVGAHALRRYSSIAGRVAPRVANGLSPAKLQRAIEFMHSNMGSPLRLVEIANSVGMSEYSFARAFRKSLGTSPHQYLTMLRIERARELLESGSLPISHIANTLGFADQSHLTALFRKALGTTPARYRDAKRC